MALEHVIKPQQILLKLTEDEIRCLMVACNLRAEASYENEEWDDEKMWAALRKKLFKAVTQNEESLT